MGHNQKDNAYFEQKLALRRHVLDAAEFTDLRVLETCAGQGLLWGRLREEYKIKTYTPCDRAPRMPGCLKLEISDRALNAFNLEKFNVIDIDPYGDCWLAWQNIRPRLTQPTCIFLTHGAALSSVVRGFGGGVLSKSLRVGGGIPQDWNLPKSQELAFHLGRRMLAKSTETLELRYGVYAQHVGAAYYGFLAVPRAA